MGSKKEQKEIDKEYQELQKKYRIAENDRKAFNDEQQKQIKKQKPTRALYAEKLAAENVVPAAESKKMVDDFQALMAEEFEAAESR